MNSLHVTSNREKIAMRISWYSIAVNVFLSLGKFIAGIFGHSAAMVSDAIHSASDVFATFIVMAGIKISGRASDDDHQYGHERKALSHVLFHRRKIKLYSSVLKQN